MDIRTPYTVVVGTETPRHATKTELVAASRALERQAVVDGAQGFVASLQDVRHVTPGTRRSYAAIAATGVPVVLFARDLPAYVAPGVRGVALDDDDPLVDVWSVVLLSATAPVALAAADLHVAGQPDADRSFSVAISRDPEVVAACAATLGAALGADLGAAEQLSW